MKSKGNVADTDFDGALDDVNLLIQDAVDCNILEKAIDGKFVSPLQKGKKTGTNSPAVTKSIDGIDMAYFKFLKESKNNNSAANANQDQPFIAA